MKRTSVTLGLIAVVVATAAGRATDVARPAPAKAEGADAAGVGTSMAGSDKVADDVLFLIMATLRARCVPARAHDLPRMAVAAQLPTLSTGAGASAAAEAMRQRVRHVINDVVHKAVCGKPVALQIGPYARVIDPEAYADAFPDSYFYPALTAPPPEFHGLPLQARVADHCSSVAYAVLALDPTGPWQCVGMRASARSRILTLCRAAGPDPDALAADIKTVVSGLPANCQ